MDRAQLERELEALHMECWGWALACCRREPDLAEDVLQSAYLRVFSGRATFDGRSTLKTWVFGVIRLTAMEEERRRRSWVKRNAGKHGFTATGHQVEMVGLCADCRG